MQPKPGRILGYARVSSLAQTQGTSLADQQASITAYAKTRGMKVTRFFVEAESGIGEKDEKREQMIALMAAVTKGDLVLCDKLDRWSRDPVFTLTSVKKIIDAGASFYAIGDALDPSTRQGDMMLGLRSVIAKEERERIRERTVGTRWKIRDAGYWVEGEVPYGYKRPLPKGTKGLEKNVLVLDDEKAANVREFFRLSLKSHSLSAIVQATGASRDVVHDALHNRIYTGQMADSKGVWMRGRHPALVSIATFEKSLSLLAARRLGGPRPRNAPSQTDPWIIRDVAACLLCGARMTSAYGGEPYWRVDYYLCIAHRKNKTCPARLVRRDAVEPRFADLVEQHLCELSGELVAAPKKAKRIAAPIVDYAAKKEQLERKRARTVEAFTDGAMSRADMRAAIAKLDGEIAQAVEAAAPAKAVTQEMRHEMLAEVSNIKKAWAMADDIRRRAIVNIVTAKARIEREKEPVAEWKTLEEVLGKAV